MNHCDLFGECYDEIMNDFIYNDSEINNSKKVSLAINKDNKNVA